MKGSEIRQKFLHFFAKNGHTVVPSSSLLPDDPSVLLTTAGMQQFKPYYTGAADAMRDFKSLNTASSQKCFRTSDIDEVGDDTHLTFFEMLGNFSFGGYLKEGAIKFAYEFITRELGLEISYVTIFEGSHGVPKDEESRAAWQALGIKDIREEGINDVFWGPTGTSGPCGPTTEIYCTNASGKDVEVWNLVFNQFFYAGSREELLAQTSGKALEPLKTPGVDTGMGLERLVMIAQKKRNLFETDLFAPFLELVPNAFDERVRRVIVDHIRGSAFLIADGVRPSNKEAGYVLRRLLRRVFAYEELYKMPVHIVDALVHDIVHEYGETYKDLGTKADTVRVEVTVERERFMRTLKKGLGELEKIQTLDAQSAFRLYETFGLPYEIIKELGGERASVLKREAFDEEFKKHQEKSRQGAEKKFGGHGLILDTGELKAKDATELQKVTRLHSATHLLQASLRKVLGTEVHQMGSDITVERTRFDFAFGRKVTPDELKAVEDLINGAIEKDYSVTKKLLPFDEAVKTGALYFFKEKYPAEVNVYTFGTSDESEVFSREFCGGPHVTHTREIGKLRILKEEASSSGVRRIRATIEP
ncbi:MAG: alanine--tRNA ligase [Patescibacteria group bacterium]